jgi:hypothetical protein
MNMAFLIASGPLQKATLLQASGAIGLALAQVPLRKYHHYKPTFSRQTYSRNMSSTDDSNRIHILGLGNLAKLFAHTIKKAHPSTPITLLFHRESQIGEWDQSNRSIEIGSNDGTKDRTDGYDIELVGDAQAEGAIRNLILATKTYGTANALMPLKKRLGSSTTILFLQNGMGT